MLLGERRLPWCLEAFGFAFPEGSALAIAVRVGGEGPMRALDSPEGLFPLWLFLKEGPSRGSRRASSLGGRRAALRVVGLSPCCPKPAPSGAGRPLATRWRRRGGVLWPKEARSPGLGVCGRFRMPKLAQNDPWAGLLGRVGRGRARPQPRDRRLLRRLLR